MVITTTLWVCTDCIQHAANGECGSCEHQNGDLTPHDREPLNLLHGFEATTGLTREEHDCPYGDGTQEFGEVECECETREFSWSQCDGCGTTLGGSRHAMTLHESDRP